jgi:hypothetical protein
MRCSMFMLICVLMLGGVACSAKRVHGTASITGVSHKPVESSQATGRGNRQKPTVDRPSMAGSLQSRLHPPRAGAQVNPPRAGAQARGPSGSGTPAESHPTAIVGADEARGDSATSGNATSYGADPTSPRPSPGPAAGEASRRGSAVMAISAAVVLAVAVLVSRRLRRNDRFAS